MAHGVRVPQDGRPCHRRRRQREQPVRPPTKPPRTGGAVTEARPVGTAARGQSRRAGRTPPGKTRRTVSPEAVRRAVALISMGGATPRPGSRARSSAALRSTCSGAAHSATGRPRICSRRACPDSRTYFGLASRTRPASSRMTKPCPSSRSGAGACRRPRAPPRARGAAGLPQWVQTGAHVGGVRLAATSGPPVIHPRGGAKPAGLPASVEARTRFVVESRRWTRGRSVGRAG